jgi:hypothetical protein
MHSSACTDSASIIRSQLLYLLEKPARLGGSRFFGTQKRATGLWPDRMQRNGICSLGVGNATEFRRHAFGNRLQSQCAFHRTDRRRVANRRSMNVLGCWQKVRVCTPALCFLRRCQSSMRAERIIMWVGLGKSIPTQPVIQSAPKELIHYIRGPAGIGTTWKPSRAACLRSLFSARN